MDMEMKAILDFTTKYPEWHTVSYQSHNKIFAIDALESLKLLKVERLLDKLFFQAIIKTP